MDGKESGEILKILDKKPGQDDGAMDGQVRETPVADELEGLDGGMKQSSLGLEKARKVVVLRYVGDEVVEIRDLKRKK